MMHSYCFKLKWAHQKIIAIVSKLFYNLKKVKAKNAVLEFFEGKILFILGIGIAQAAYYVFLHAPN